MMRVLRCRRLWVLRDCDAWKRRDSKEFEQEVWIVGS